MQSSIWREALAEGRTEGEAEGRVIAERKVCLDLLRRHHLDPHQPNQIGGRLARGQDPPAQQGGVVAGVDSDSSLRNQRGRRPERAAEVAVGFPS